MSATEMKKLKTLAEKLTAFHGVLEVQSGADDLYNPAHQKAYRRLQATLSEFGKDPLNPDKSKSMLHAIDTYQTANEMMILKVQNLLDQIGCADENATYEDVFREYI